MPAPPPAAAQHGLLLGGPKLPHLLADPRHRGVAQVCGDVGLQARSERRDLRGGELCHLVEAPQAVLGGRAAAGTQEVNHHAKEIGARQRAVIDPLRDGGRGDAQKARPLRPVVEPRRV